jgi:hypothetical protein
MKKIFLLLGEDAVNELQENGVKGCIKNGYNMTAVIEYNGQTKMTEVVQQVLNAVDGSLGSCIISKESFDAIEKAFRPKKKAIKKKK